VDITYRVRGCPPRLDGGVSSHVVANVSHNAPAKALARPLDREGALLEGGAHELALMEDLLTTVTSEAAGAQVHIVRVEVGRLACASPHALRFCFEICAHGTALEGAALDIVETSGEELRLKEIEVT
jgi:hypothetical protein